MQSDHDDIESEERSADSWLDSAVTVRNAYDFIANGSVQIHLQNPTSPLEIFEAL